MPKIQNTWLWTIWIFTNKIYLNPWTWQDSFWWPVRRGHSYHFILVNVQIRFFYFYHFFVQKRISAQLETLFFVLIRSVFGCIFSDKRKSVKKKIIKRETCVVLNLKIVVCFVNKRLYSVLLNSVVLCARSSQEQFLTRKWMCVCICILNRFENENKDAESDCFNRI